MATPAHDTAEAVRAADEALLAAASAGDDAQASCRHLRSVLRALGVPEMCWWLCRNTVRKTAASRQFTRWFPWQVHAALAAGADAAYQEPTHGRSALMAAAEAGHEQVRGQRSKSSVCTPSRNEVWKDAVVPSLCCASCSLTADRCLRIAAAVKDSHRCEDCGCRASYHMPLRNVDWDRGHQELGQAHVCRDTP